MLKKLYRNVSDWWRSFSENVWVWNCPTYGSWILRYPWHPMTVKIAVSPRVLYTFYAFQGADESAPNVSQSGTHGCGTLPPFRLSRLQPWKFCGFSFQPKAWPAKSTQVDLIKITLVTHPTIAWDTIHIQRSSWSSRNCTSHSRLVMKPRGLVASWKMGM